MSRTRSSRLVAAILGAMLLVAFVACGTPVETTPRRLALYHGEWSGPNVTLSISPRGIDYRKRGGLFHSAYLAGGFRGLSGNDIIWGMKRNRLRVSVPPHRVGAVWKMTVEGDELERR